MTKNNPSQDNISDLDDLIEHGVKDIIPENEEYYTLDLKRNFDGDAEEDDELSGFDVSNIDPHNLDELDEPPKSASLYSDATVVYGAGDPRSISNNQDETENNRVGGPGHWGVDEDTE